jgi:hypothetical protein
LKKNLHSPKTRPTFAARNANKSFGLWCNGNTAVFGTAFLGSNPGKPTLSLFRFVIGLWCNGNTAVFGTAFLGSNPGKPTGSLS